MNKSYGHDISIRLLKACDAKEVRPLPFKNCVQYGLLSNMWIKLNIVSGHK